MVIEFKASDLESKLKKYEEDNWSEQDVITDLYEQGYTIDSFRYDPERYRWAKRVATTYGLI
jgi:hypothetical protein